MTVTPPMVLAMRGFLALTRQTMTELAQWVFSLMVMLSPPRHNDVARLRELVIAATAIADASEQDPLPDGEATQTAAMLVAIASYESQFHLHALGKQSEIGMFQLKPPVPRTVREQAREAIRRVRVSYEVCGDLSLYSGECGGKKRTLAQHRAELAWRLLSDEPWGL